MHMLMRVYVCRPKPAKKKIASSDEEDDDEDMGGSDSDAFSPGAKKKSKPAAKPAKVCVTVWSVQ
jgi:hypothetical protein